MATKGLSKPYWAKYNYDAATKKVTYSGGGKLGKLTELSINLNDTDANILSADNAPAESDVSFSGGTAEITTDDLLPEVGCDVLGTREEAVQGVTGLTTTDAKWYVDDDTTNAPYLGFGGILEKQINNVTKYVALVLEKIQFTTPGDHAVTRGEKIDWQTKTLSATIMRSDGAGHAWRRISSLLDTEEDAELLIRSYLNITDTPTESGGEPVVAAAGGKAASK